MSEYPSDELALKLGKWLFKTVTEDQETLLALMLNFSLQEELDLANHLSEEMVLSNKCECPGCKKVKDSMKAREN